MGVTSYDDTCKDGLIRRKILAKHDPEFFIAMTDSHLWKTYIDVYDRLLKASSFPTVLTFTNTNGEIVDLNIAFEMMQDSLLTAVPRASEELSVLATTTMKELRVAVGKCCAAMDMSEDQVGRISAKTEKSNRAYNRQVEDILANWALKLKELSVKIAKNAHHEDTQNAVKKQVDGMLPELVDARTEDRHATALEDQKKQAAAASKLPAAGIEDLTELKKQVGGIQEGNKLSARSVAKENSGGGHNSTGHDSSVGTLMASYAAVVEKTIKLKETVIALKQEIVD
ncbi:unnamed protein product [Zymoseptoria tritici ST99CH_1E4]|uniref:Uncharacterized protein n=1 Tax=Zymoseptoria tritici ST99CH_1E4 TaxID=1276532 RepID=A0A2H1H8V6_ZYMTR|nr:unnamed protein product [Zymoseptoria tritici ST99CH_1E4]